MAGSSDKLDGLSGSLFRELTVFLTTADSNSVLDSAEEAALHAEKIKGVLEGSNPANWGSKFDTKNLESWYDQFLWLAKPENFIKWKKWRGEALSLKGYLLERHLYQFPTRYLGWPEGSEGRDSKQLYYRNPASARVEEKIVEAVEKAGSAQKIIDTIEALKSAYPGEFNGFWDEFLNFQKVRPFDGREPYTLSIYLEVVAEIAVRKDMLAFIRRIDSLSRKKFQFQTASRYFRYHDQWLEKGEAFFVILEKRWKLEGLFEDYGVLQHIDINDLDRFAEMNPKLLDELKHFIDEAGAKEFFPSRVAMECLSIYGENLSSRLKDFLDLFQEKGADWLRNIHHSCHMEGVSLEYIPFYRLVAALEKELGDVQPILPFLEVFADPLAAFGYWFYRSYDEYFLRWAGRGRESETFLKDMVPSIVALHKLGLLLPLSRNFKQGNNSSRNGAVFLALLGKEFRRREGNDFWGETVDIDPLRVVDLKSKIFWTQTALQTSGMPIRRHIRDEQHTLGAIKEQYGIFDLNLPRPSEAELKRFEKWLDRVVPPNSDKRNFAVSRSDRQALLYHILLSQNGRVPSEEELEIYEREILSETDNPWTRFIFGRLDVSLWKEAPHALKGVLYFISDNSSDADSPTTFSVLELLKDPKVRHKLKEHEDFLMRFSREEQDLFNDIFMHMDFPFIKDNDKNKENLLNYLSTVQILFEKNRAILEQFFGDASRAGIERKNLQKWHLFKHLFDYYATHGSEAFFKITHQWHQLRLDFLKSGNFDRFFNLTETDISRLKIVADLVDGKFLFADAEKILSLAEDSFGQLILFLQNAETNELKLSLGEALCLYDMPQILELYRLLRQHKMEDKWEGMVSLLMSPWFASEMKQELEKLLKDLKRPDAILEKLERLFNEYRFDEYSGFFVPVAKNVLFFPADLSGLAVFDTELKPAFFGRRERSWEGNEVTVWGNRNEPETHPFQRDDPEHRFQINDYAFYMHGLSPHTYSTVMQGKSREDIIESLLIQFEGLPIQERKEQRLYSSSEGASRSLLEALPLAQLLKLQWLLNNLQDPEFRQSVRKIAEEDFNDKMSEAGGYMVPQSLRSEGIRSLHEPLELVTLPSPKRTKYEALLRRIEEMKEKSENPKESALIKAHQEMLLKKIDESFIAPDFLLENRFGTAFHFHFHSTASSDSSLYAGPSGSISERGGDIAMSAMFGDGVVFTRLGPNKFDADFYGVYPLKDASGNIHWREFVIDLGVYQD